MEEQGHKDYRSLGEILRDARVAQGKSLQDLAELTKIAPKSIQALEADDLDRLAGPVYIRSFTKTLAEALSLDVEFLLTKLSQASSAMGTDPTAQVKPLDPIPTTTRVVRDPATHMDSVVKRDETTWHVEKVRVTRVEAKDSGSPVLRWMLIVSAVVVVAAVLIILVQNRSADGRQLGESGLQQSSLGEGAQVALVDPDAGSSSVAAPAEEKKDTPAKTPPTQTEIDASKRPSTTAAPVAQPIAKDDSGREEEIVPPQDIRPVATNTGSAPGPRRKQPEPEAEAEKEKAEIEEEVAEATPVAVEQTPANETPKDVEISDPSTGNLGSILRPDDSEGARPMRNLHISATDDVEIWVGSDGEAPKRHLLRRGASMTFDGRDHFSLRLEEPSSVVVVLDGVRHDPPAGLIGEWIIWAEDTKQ